MELLAQARFARALLDPDLPVRDLLAANSPADEGFDVHRNNVVAGLVDALAAAFPALVRLLGAAYFAALGAAFVRARPPASAVLIEYGDEFAGFIEAFPPLAHLPWLGDVARLERLRTRAYHATDAAPLDPASLAHLDGDALLALRLQSHPGTALLQSAHPVLALWEAQSASAPPAAIEWRAQAVLVWRSGYEVQQRALAEHELQLLRALCSGASLGTALSDLASTEGTDLALARLIADGVFAAPTSIPPPLEPSP